MVAMKSATDNADKMAKALSDAIQPRPPEPDHDRAVGDHGRRGGDEELKRRPDTRKQLTNPTAAGKDIPAAVVLGGDLPPSPPPVRGMPFATSRRNGLQGVDAPRSPLYGAAMRTRLTSTVVIATVTAGLLGTGVGCEAMKANPRTTGTAVGAGQGAGIGAAVAGGGKKTQGALIGAGVGAATGWVAGNAADEAGKKNDRESRQHSRDEYNDYYDRSRQADYRDRADLD